MTDTPETPENADEKPQRPVYDGPSVDIAEEMKTAYLDYAMSVIVSRAIPDLRDGLKPVHRRILYAMHETGNGHDKPYRKSARPVGDVMGKYHPHGDAAIYDALVRMAQDFSMSLPLLDGQGNFGSMDGDNAAAMRYTEVRMDKPAASLLADIEKETVDFQDNYDGKDREPTVLPARFPNMLVNGAGGIAVGMATNIPPHNLGEVIDGTLALIEDPDLSMEALMEIIPAPDFPTGGIILGRSGARKAYLEGRGSVIIRARTRVEEIRKDRYAIVLDEIPYQVNKATMIEKIAEMARDKRIEGIAHVQDESDRVGVRVVVELKRDSTPEVVLNQLFRFTPMQTSFGCNMLALNGGRPETLTLRDFLTYFISFREEVVARRTAFDLRKARERSHVLCGLAVAVSNVDEVVATIRSSADPAEAREKLMTRRWPAHDIVEYIRLIDDPTHPINEDGTYNLSETQARAILDLRLQRLTAMGVKEVTDELQDLAAKIRDYLDILGSRERIMAIISDELKRGEGGLRCPPPHRDRRLGRRHGRRGPDRARGHGRHDHLRRLHQAHAAGRFPCPTARRQGSLVDGDEGRRRRHHALRRQHPYPASVLHYRRHGLQAEDLATALGRAHREGQGDRQHPADPDRHFHRRDHAGGRAGGGMGGSSDLLRHLRRRCAPERAVGFHQREVERQDRDETARRREPRERADLRRER